VKEPCTATDLRLTHTHTSSPSAVEQKRICMFLCSAVVSSLDMMVDGHIKITDFTLHDAARDLLFLSESHVAQTKLMVRLEELSTELAEEQDRSEELLFSMLPRSVVEDLKEGRRVRGQEYEAVTILFSDIVGFTDMSAQCKPTQVCHVSVLVVVVGDGASRARGGGYRIYVSVTPYCHRLCRLHHPHHPHHRLNCCCCCCYPHC